jgi:hypothetical protein
MNIDTETLTELGALLAEGAWEIFSNMGYKSDFCVQNVTATGAVFGGWNRLLWSAQHGFRPDYSYCTREFLDKWEKVYLGA